MWRNPVVWMMAVASSLWIAHRVRGRSRRAPGANRVAAIDAPRDADLDRCRARLDQLWALVGQPRPAHRGLLEHAGTLGEDQASLRALSEQVVECVYRGTYGGEAIPPEETARFMGALDAETRSADGSRAGSGARR
jgi:hypothetical protein